jgi:predicted RecA/RadA family phage recombinase
MKNSVNKGNGLAIIATKNVNSGDIIVSGKIVGVAVFDALQGEPVEVSTVGVYEVTKELGETFTAGQRLYLNPSDLKLSNHKSPLFAGHAWEASASEAETALVRLSYAGNLELENAVFVDSALDFPEPVAGVIPIAAGKTYIITSDVDLGGNRIECQGVAAIFGLNSETCFLSSTGLGAGFPLIASNYSLPIQNLSITADWAIDLDGDGTGAAIDWKALNFVDCPRVGTVKNVTNFIYESSALLNSAGFELDGAIGTIGIETCLFSGNGSATDILKIADTCVILRRFRCIFSSFISFGAQTAAINFSSSATVPNDSYILFKCNFSGGSIYLVGVSALDNKANFDGNKGIENSGSIFSYYMADNATPTPIGTAGVYTKILGTTIAGPINQRFGLVNNRATNAGELSGFYKVAGTVSMISGNNNQLGARVAFNGVTLESSQSKTTANGSGRAENLTFFGLVEITGGAPDYIEIFATNYTTTNAVTVTDLNVIGERLN